ncbi:Kinase, NEK [Giardia duodenalis]|uniref:non-specific serine/threonine protein kinase n=2 Tax=Giardia intestinalis TaxID=5741 RepID=A8B353_GIAIC|nr:Kinase, NEK [Giardia intestinalis]ESU38096.1 Serine/threonine protein kinase [Giardia intestinalis]KAE8303102.1 Kinase, NEK [Giardia intestinalis]|eukprot:XP_001710127.1 Kinase, NEK [Giardia lamblia ATCC 50803]
MSDPTIHDAYDFVAICGAGSFGKVHKVRSKEDGQIYACKEINYAKMSSKEKELLVSEVNLLRKLNHPNIVKYIRRYQDKAATLIYIVMDYCSKGDLSDYVKMHKKTNQYISEDKIWSIFAQLLIALDYCHSPNKPDSSGVGRVIHRDLKTANVFLCEDGSIKLGDFGLCRVLEQSTMAKTNVGTPLYMAPELLENKSYTEKVDIWSLGCIIYELCALQPPYVATSLDSLKAKVKRGVRPFVPNHFSPDLRRIIDMMLIKEPEKRPSTTELIQLPVIAKLLQGLAYDPARNCRGLQRVEQMTPVDRAMGGNLRAPSRGMAPPPSAGYKPVNGRYSDGDLDAWEDRLKEREAALANWEDAISEKETNLKERLAKAGLR